MKKLFSVILASVMVMQVSSFSAMAEDEIVIHVSTTGASTGTGTATDPVDSLNTATEIAKNYLTQEELQALNRMVSAYLDIAEINACYTCFAGQSEYISNVLTKENADYIGMDISDYLALTPEQKLKANDKIGNGHAGDSVNRRFDQLMEDIHEAVKAVK